MDGLTDRLPSTFIPLRPVLSQKQMLDILVGLKRGDCWCEMGIGNPMVREHDVACLQAQLAVAQLKAQLKDGDK